MTNERRACLADEVRHGPASAARLAPKGAGRSRETSSNGSASTETDDVVARLRAAAMSGQP